MYGEHPHEPANRYSYIQTAPGGEPSRNGKRQSTLSVPKRGDRPVVPRIQTPPQSPIMASPTAALTDPATHKYPLNDIDYESDPVAVAQEISNLQALRRMSMDVSSTADPDLPSFNSFVPPTPPDDSDPGSVFWVPARLHPELAPQEFSAYLEKKKNEIRRPKSVTQAQATTTTTQAAQTQATGSLTPDNPAGPSLRRKKSMLSRQIDTDSAKHYRDGAERLEKRKSSKADPGPPSIQLDDLMKDPTALMHKLSADSQRRMEEGKSEAKTGFFVFPPPLSRFLVLRFLGDREEDVPIVSAPKVGLKRSTATHYRKGSLRRGERVGSKRAAVIRAADTDSEDFASPPPPPPPPPSSEDRDELRPMRQGASTPSDELAPMATGSKHKSVPTAQAPAPKGSPRSRTSEPSPPVPKIVETPPTPIEHPERRASLEPPAPGSLKKRPPPASDVSSDHTAVVVPPPEQLKIERKKRPDSLGPGSGSSTSTSTSTGTGKDRKTSWGWLLGDKEEHREQKEREREEKVKAKKEKRPKSAEKGDKHDNTRLDVLQKSIELGNTGKVIGADPAAAATIKEDNRSDLRESRKSREDKKDKDSGFLSFFGGSRKKSGEHAAGEKKGRSPSRGTSPDPQQEKPQPFYYTRFPIHIERAIYRLSHLKLANPRRPLHQQVLLSNFMYSYLAKVQQTQPHLIQQATVSQSQQQKQQAAEQQRQQEQQRWQQRQEEQQQYSDQPRGNSHDDVSCAAKLTRWRI